MAYTLGTLHDLLGGSGSIGVAAPYGLLVDVFTVPMQIGIQPGTPPLYHRIGHLTPADANGWHERVILTKAKQLIIPVPEGLTLVGYDLALGVGISIRELVGGTAASMRPASYDRNPVPVRIGSNAQLVGGVGLTTFWSYTVPSGRRLMLAGAYVRQTRAAAYTAMGGVISSIALDGTDICRVISYHNTVGGVDSQSLGGGELVIYSGSVLTGSGQNGDAGGDVRVDLRAIGYLFDA